MPPSTPKPVSRSLGGCVSVSVSVSVCISISVYVLISVCVTIYASCRRLLASVAKDVVVATEQTANVEITSKPDEKRLKVG